MLFTLQYPARVGRLMVLDIAPTHYPDSHSPYLQAMMQLDLDNLKSRAEAERQLKTAIPDMPTRLFLLQSLKGTRSAYYWSLNLPVLFEFMSELTDFPVRQISAANPSLFVAGELSNYLLLDHHAKIRQLFPNASFQTIAKAGHWLHAQQPIAVCGAFKEFLQT